jgi:shikimate dehydrogenase
MEGNLKLKKFGLIGKDISYSFSKRYFENKFLDNKYKSYSYENFDLENISDVVNVFKIDNLSGLNVTIPYKEKIIPYLDELTTRASKIGAVNTIIFRNKKKIGDNTDVIGFENAMKAFIKPLLKKAIILGSGGASKAIQFVLKNSDIAFIVASRNPNKDQIKYIDLNEKLINEYPIIINCTPLGTFPKIEFYPKIPYENLSSKNYLIDLIYNPKKTEFMKKGIKNGAKVSNGYLMLIQQAEASWKLWETSII